MKNIKMHKFSILIGLITVAVLFSNLLVFSVPQQRQNTCPSKPYPVSNFFTRNIQRFMGLNLAVTAIAEEAIEDSITKLLDKGEVKVNIKGYSAMDLVAGKFKTVQLKAKNIAKDGVYISSLEAKSLCNFTQIDRSSDPVVPLSPVYIGFKGIITDSDINNIVSSDQYRQKLKGVSIKLFNQDIDLVDFLNLKANIIENKLVIKTDIHFNGMPDYMKLPVKMGIGLKVIDNKLRVSDLQMITKPLGGELNLLSNFITFQRPVIVDFNSLSKKGSDIKIKKFSIENNKVNLEGTVWLPENYRG
ncbi:MAG: hypothetical protein PHC34_07960 [Candidatus Gastranaerophilales bacterium]|nr:hypothetical protein [Candidatus Gastranaerophilales bacterium]